MSSSRLLAVCVLLCSANVAADTECSLLPVEVKIVGGALSVEQVEQASLIRVGKNPNVPQVTFGRGHDKWLEFVAMLRPEDQLFEFIYSTEDEGSYSYGGYVAMRGECMVGKYRTWIT